jgi:hypothetical protein
MTQRVRTSDHAIAIDDDKAPSPARKGPYRPLWPRRLRARCSPPQHGAPALEATPAGLSPVASRPGHGLDPTPPRAGRTQAQSGGMLGGDRSRRKRAVSLARLPALVCTPPQRRAPALEALHASLPLASPPQHCLDPPISLAGCTQARPIDPLRWTQLVAKKPASPTTRRGRATPVPSTPSASGGGPSGRVRQPTSPFDCEFMPRHTAISGYTIGHCSRVLWPHTSIELLEFESGLSAARSEARTAEPLRSYVCSPTRLCRLLRSRR